MKPEAAPAGRRASALGLLPWAAAAAPMPAPPAEVRAQVEVTAPAPAEPTVTRLDPRRPALDGADLLRTVPGFNVTRKGGSAGEPVLRGLAGSRLGILADGEETPGGCGGRMDPPTAYLHPGSYDQVEVVKGPQTVLDGPGWPAGVVRFRRSPPRWDHSGWSGAASWQAGGFGQDVRWLKVQAGTALGYGRWEGIRARSGDYRSGAGTLVHARQDRWNLFGALGWTPVPGFRMELRGTRGDGQAAYADRAMDGVAFLRRNLGLVLEWRDPWRPVERMELHAYLNDVDHSMDNATLRPFTPGPGGTGPSARNPRRTTRGLRGEAAVWTGRGHRWVLGAEFQASRHDLRRTGDAWAVPLERLGRAPDAALERAGAFAEWTRPAALTWVAGLRLDRWQAWDLRERLAPGRANPTAGARRRDWLPGGFVRAEWDLGAGASAHAGLGHGSRPPDYWEMFPLEAETSGSAFGLRPERTTQLDLGGARRFGPVRASLSAYCGVVDGYILVQSGFPGPAGAATVARNVQARIWGGELALAAGDGPWRAEASLAWAWGENRSERRPLAQMPPPEARLGLGWSRPQGSLGTRVRLVAPQDRAAPGQGTIAGLDQGRTPGFAVVGLDGSWAPGRAVRLEFGIDNLFGRDYAEHLGRPGAAVPGYPPAPIRIPEPGRLAWIRMTFRHPHGKDGP